MKPDTRFLVAAAGVLLAAATVSLVFLLVDRSPQAATETRAPLDPPESPEESSGSPSPASLLPATEAGEAEAIPNAGASPGVAPPDEELVSTQFLERLARCLDSETTDMPTSPEARRRALVALADIETPNPCQGKALRELLALSDSDDLLQLDLQGLIRIVAACEPECVKILRLSSDTPTPADLALSTRLLQTGAPSPETARALLGILIEHGDPDGVLTAFLDYTKSKEREDGDLPATDAWIQGQEKSRATIALMEGSRFSCMWREEAMAAVESPANLATQNVGFAALRRLAREGDTASIHYLQMALGQSIEQAMSESRLSIQAEGRLAGALIAVDEIGADEHTIRLLEGLYQHPQPSVRAAAVSAASHLLHHVPIEFQDDRVLQIRYLAQTDPDPAIVGKALQALRRVDPNWVTFAESLRGSLIDERSVRVLEEMLKTPK